MYVLYLYVLNTDVFLIVFEYAQFVIYVVLFYFIFILIYRRTTWALAYIHQYCISHIVLFMYYIGRPKILTIFYILKTYYESDEVFTVLSFSLIRKIILYYYCINCYCINHVFNNVLDHILKCFAVGHNVNIMWLRRYISSRNDENRKITYNNE